MWSSPGLYLRFKLWNVFYDSLLRIAVLDGVLLIGYADNLAVVITAKTKFTEHHRAIESRSSWRNIIYENQEWQRGLSPAGHLDQQRTNKNHIHRNLHKAFNPGIQQALHLNPKPGVLIGESHDLIGQMFLRSRSINSRSIARFVTVDMSRAKPYCDAEI